MSTRPGAQQHKGVPWHTARRCTDGCGAEAGEQCMSMSTNKPKLIPCGTRKFQLGPVKPTGRVRVPERCAFCDAEVLRVPRVGRVRVICEARDCRNRMQRERRINEKAKSEHAEANTAR